MPVGPPAQQWLTIVTRSDDRFDEARGLHDGVPHGGKGVDRRGKRA